VIGKHITEIVPDIKASGRYDQHLEVLKTGKTFRIQDFIPHPVFGDRHFVLQSFKAGEDLGVIATDITSHKQLEIQLQKSLQEKTLLIKEIHHRVKNNMQLISSLLNLEISKTDNRDVHAILRESQNRILSMARIHQALYQSRDFSKIEFKSYIERLISNLRYSYQSQVCDLSLTIQVDEMALGIDQAVPLALILNELISNVFKHGFPKHWQGRRRLTVRLNRDKEDQVYLSVQDNGIGFPGRIDFRKTETLGLQLVLMLVEDQLDGRIQMTTAKGTSFEIVFKAE
jgi:two-component sensor histidine kinase